MGPLGRTARPPRRRRPPARSQVENRRYALRILDSGVRVRAILEAKSLALDLAQGSRRINLQRVEQVVGSLEHGQVLRVHQRHLRHVGPVAGHDHRRAAWDGWSAQDVGLLVFMLECHVVGTSLSLISDDNLRESYHLF